MLLSNNNFLFRCLKWPSLSCPVTPMLCGQLDDTLKVCRVKLDGSKRGKEGAFIRITIFK